jgi:hypothetical protein
MIQCPKCGQPARAMTHEQQDGPIAARTTYYHAERAPCTIVHLLATYTTKGLPA